MDELRKNRRLQGLPPFESRRHKKREQERPQTKTSFTCMQRPRNPLPLQTFKNGLLKMFAEKDNFVQKNEVKLKTLAQKVGQSCESRTYSTSVTKSIRLWKRGLIYTLKVANNRFVSPIGMCTIKLEVHNLLQPFESLVLPSCSHKVILGWRFLEASKAIIDCGQSQIRFS
ncbi:hypothetical protein LAZ67_18001109 [Cordylochernes scorpioides]|uniref:Uncharacterized protein n=1 Tax=Cordylochernes scorpioides TaxID=51811 RepID=A0ABY6LFL5_9ARAC|nr:hypothetical protein LAZ67_18001109 [Cordylochernes scorpioides]